MGEYDSFTTKDWLMAGCVGLLVLPFLPCYFMYMYSLNFIEDADPEQKPLRKIILICVWLGLIGLALCLSPLIISIILGVITVVLGVGLAVLPFIPLILVGCLPICVILCPYAIVGLIICILGCIGVYAIIAI